MHKLNDAGLEAAADILDKTGRHHGRWPKYIKPWKELDSIGTSEFLGIVEQIVAAYVNTPRTD
jgi:hypothetical protein